MSYEVGAHVDLTRLNKKGGLKPSMFQEAISTAYEVGTEIRFSIQNGQTKASRRIPVVYA